MKKYQYFATNIFSRKKMWFFWRFWPKNWKGWPDNFETFHKEKSGFLETTSQELRMLSSSLSQHFLKGETNLSLDLFFISLSHWEVLASCQYKIKNSKRFYDQLPGQNDISFISDFPPWRIHACLLNPCLQVTFFQTKQKLTRLLLFQTILGTFHT